MVTGFDYFLLAFLGFFAFKGFKKGFFMQLFEGLALFGSLLISLQYFVVTNAIIADFVTLPPSVEPAIGIFITWAVTFFAIYFLGKFVDKLINFTPLGILNRIAGIAAGAIKGAIIMIPIIFILSYLEASFINQSVIIQSVTPFKEIAIEQLKIVLGISNESSTALE